MTFAVLRALHAIIGDALDDIQRVYATPPAPSSDPSESFYASPPPSPGPASFISSPLDFPSLDLPYDPNDPAELLRTHPVVSAAVNKIIAASGQICATVQTPFMTLMDASMGYHLPSCLRLLEASDSVEFLREAGPDGLHADILSQHTGIDSSRLAHIFRLLATHHIIREREPNIFTLNRLSSIVDSGKSTDELKDWKRQGRPEMKYHTTNGAAALIGLNTDELMKTSAFMTEAYLLSPADPLLPPFQYAFHTDVPFFPWLEGESSKKGSPLQDSLSGSSPATVNKSVKNKDAAAGDELLAINPNRFRLERFGAAMQGTCSWEIPGAILHGFDWRALPRDSTIVDVGGGIGSTSMLLANTFARHTDVQNLGFRFIIQDRPVVVEMGEKAWRAKHPELLDSGTAYFQVHDFFAPQPVKNAAVFILRVVLHDWADAQARIILERLREAATADTKLLLGDFVLPLACADKFEEGEEGFHILRGIEGVDKTLAHPPLLANLGKASSHGYWMDMTMQTVFNAQERTLREIVTLASSAGWKVVRVHCAEGSLFGHITAVPAEIPPRLNDASSITDSEPEKASKKLNAIQSPAQDLPRARTPIQTFGSKTHLPSVHENRMDKLRSRVANLVGRTRTGGNADDPPSGAGARLHAKKRPSPLSSSSSDKPALAPSRRRSLASSSLSQKTPPSPKSPTQRARNVLGSGQSGSQTDLVSPASSAPVTPPPTKTGHQKAKEPSSPSHSSLSQRYTKRKSFTATPRKLSLSLSPSSPSQDEGGGDSRKGLGSGLGRSIGGVASLLSSRKVNSDEETGGAREKSVQVPTTASVPVHWHDSQDLTTSSSSPSPCPDLRSACIVTNLAEPAKIEGEI